MEFDNLAFSAFFFEETFATLITTSSSETTCFTASILWEIHEKIIKIKRQKLPIA